MESSIQLFIRTAFLVTMITVATILIVDGNVIGCIVYAAEIARFVLSVIDAIRRERK